MHKRDFFFTVSFIFSIKTESSSFGRQDSCDLRFDPTRAGVSTTGAEEVSARGGNPTTLRALVTSALRCVPHTDISPVAGSGRVCVRGQSRQIHRFSMNKMAACECLPLVEA